MIARYGLKSARTQPRVVSLRNSTSFKHLCGATILSQHFAVTAAHCVHFDEKDYLLQLNNYCTEGSAPKAIVLKIIAHELYDKQTRAHDVALLRISLQLDDVISLDDTLLPTSSFGLSGECTIYGYGSKCSEKLELSEDLQAANVLIVSLDKCVDELGPIAPKYNSGMLCAVGETTDSSQGDSGSPLFCGSVIEGITSYGLGSGAPGVPAVYTSVGAHLSWIRNVMINTFT